VIGVKGISLLALYKGKKEKKWFKCNNRTYNQ
jgi:hypothetical protein